MKRSARDYVLTLTLAVVVFAVVAFFLYQIAQSLMGDVINKIGSEGENPTTQEQNDDGSTPVGGGSAASGGSGDRCAVFLLVGTDRKQGNADAIFLVGINETKKQAAVSLIPSDTLVTDTGTTQKLGEAYAARGIGFLKEFVTKNTGVAVDYYAVMKMDALENLIDFLGGITYNVPENMYYFDSSQNLHINLKQGTQKLTGSQALQLVCYRGYAAGNSAREDTQLSFARSFCDAFLTPANLSRAKSILYNVTYNVESDFREADLNELGEMIFHFSDYAQSYIRLPGKSAANGYTLDVSRAKSVFQSYR